MPIETTPLPFMGKPQLEAFTSMWSPADDGCWLWTDRADAAGYGLFSVAGRDIKAHRIALALHTGRDPHPFFVCHSCDNPKCVNPAHLWTGTNRDNVLDRESKGRTRIGRQRASPEHCYKCGHHRTDDYVEASGLKRCRACQKARDRARRKKSNPSKD